MSEWKTYKIGDLSKSNAASYSKKDNWSFVNYLDTGNITCNDIASIQHIDLSTEKLPSRAKRKVKYNSIVYSTVRPNQRHYGIIKEQPENFLVSTGFTVLDIDESIADPDYIYYYLTQYEIVELLHAIAEQSVSAYPSIKASDIEELEITLPNIETQKKISGMLTSIDGKINVNTTINKNLRAQAQAIYTSLFISNSNPQWEMGVLSDLIAVKYGKDHKKLEDGIYPVYGSGGIMRYVERPLYTGESVLIPRKGTLNNVMYVNGAFWSVDTMFYTEMLRPNIAKFVYHFMKAKDLASLNAGSAVPSMTTNILNAMQVRLPDDETLLRFENSVAPMYEMMKENDQQSATLASLRDVLLPQLMSGELDIAELDLKPINSCLANQII